MVDGYLGQDRIAANHLATIHQYDHCIQRCNVGSIYIQFIECGPVNRKKFYETGGSFELRAMVLGTQPSSLVNVPWVISSHHLFSQRQRSALPIQALQ